LREGDIHEVQTTGGYSGGVRLYPVYDN